MSARDDLIYRITRHCSAETAAQLLDAHRAEVVAERDAMTITWLTKKAREFRAMGGKMRAAQADAVAAMASKLARGAVRPDNLRMLPADFFELGHAYQRGIDEFRCHAIVPDPHSGEIRAIGLRSRNGFPWTGAAMDPDDWEHGGWTDVTESGDGRD